MRGLDLRDGFEDWVASAKEIEVENGCPPTMIQLRFALGEVSGEPGFVDESAASQDETGELGDSAIVQLQTGGLGGHFMVEQAGIDREDAREPPVDGSELTGEAHFDGIDGPEALDVSADEFFERAAVLIGEDDGVVGEAAMLECV